MPTRVPGARPAGAAGVLLPSAALLSAGGLLAGCYRDAPFAAAGVPAAGAEVRLHLTPEGRERVAPALGAQTAVVAGRVEGARGGAVSLLVSSTTRADGGTVRWVGERVTIPLGAVARGERRVLDRRRSLLAGGGVALAAAAGYALLRAAGGGGAGAGGEQPVPTP
jgi:hypothetical protein